MATPLAQVEEFLAYPSTPEMRAQFLASVPLQTLVGLLGSGSASTEETVCQALVRLLGGDHPDSRAFLTSPEGSLLVPAGLSHRSVLVRKTTVELLSSKTFDEEWVGWLRSQGFLLLLLKAVVDPIIQVGTAASTALLKAAATPMGREGIFVESKDQLWLQCEDDTDSIVQLRVLELVCKIWQLSSECAEMSKQTPARATLVGMIDSDDILLQLNAVEIIALLPPQEIGKDIMPKLADAMEMCGEQVVFARLLECLCRFVAELPEAAADAISPDLEATLHRVFLARLQASNPSGDQEVSDLLHALAILCTSPRGFASLARSSNAPAVIAALPGLIQSLHHPTRLAALEASMRLLQHATGAEYSVLCEQKLASLTPFLLSLARGPVPEQKIGALCLFRSMALHVWGLRSMFAQSDFLTFMTDRRVETFKRALDEKFGVVSTSVNHPEILDIVGEERLTALRAFVAQGAYYTPNHRGPDQVQVASEHL